MKVLQVVPRYIWNTGEFYHLPLGLGYIAAIAEQEGHEVHALNLNSLGPDHNDQLREKLRAFKPDMVTTGSLSAFGGKVRDIVQIAREEAPDALTVIGGGMLGGDPEPVMRMTGAHVGVIGEGEDSFREVLRTHQGSGDFAAVDGLIFRSDRRSDAGALVRNKPRAAITALDDLPWPNYDLMGFAAEIDRQRCNDVYIFQSQPDSNPRSIDMITSRSCPFSCTFCFHPAGKVYRERDLEKFFEELAFYKEKYRINTVQIVDELFSLRRDRLHEFCERMEPLGLQWLVQLHVNSADRETLAKMERSGCTFISYGIESMDPTVLVSMKKKAKVERVDASLRMTQEARIGIQGNLIFGDTVETVETANNTLKRWARNPSYQIWLNVLKVYPGSPDYIEAVRDGLITDRDNYVTELPIEVNISRMNDENLLLLKRLIANYSHGLLLTTELKEWKLSDRRCEGRKPAYDFTFACPSCGDEHTYLGAVIENRRAPNIRVTCRSCRVRGQIPNPLKNDECAATRSFERSRLTRATAHVASGDNEGAKALLREIMALDSVSDLKAEAAVLLGLLLQKEGHVPNALVLFSWAVIHAPFVADHHFQLSNALVRMGIYGGAILHLRQALRLDPGHKNAKTLLEQIERSCTDEQKETYVISISHAPPPQRKRREKKNTRVRHADKLNLSGGRFDVEPEFAHLEPVA